MATATRPSRRPVALALAFAILASLAAFAPRAQALGPPQVTDTWVTDVKATSANLRAEIDAGGEPTTYRFEYIAEDVYLANLDAQPPRDPFFGASSAPTGSDASAGSAEIPHAVVQHLGGLSASTSYRYRVRASSPLAPPGGLVGPTRPLRTQQSGPVFTLPDGRAWELVSPLDKSGGDVAGPGNLFGGGVMQAAADGDSVTYGSSSSFAGAIGAPGASQYISDRSAAGWSTLNITRATLSGEFGDQPDGVPYRLFSSDLASALHLAGSRCGPAEPCPHGLQLIDLAGGDGVLTSPTAPDLVLVGADPGLNRVVFSTCAALTGEATEVPAGGGGCDPAAPNLYEWEGANLSLVNVPPGQTLGSPDAALAASSGAVSSADDRVYWTQDGDLYLGSGATGVEVDGSVGGGGTFEAASTDGAVAFFSKAGHLYRFLTAGGSTTDLTPGGGLIGVLGASADGSAVYYLDGAGVELWRGGTTEHVAAAADPSSYPEATGTSHVSADGRVLAFVSTSPLTDFDNAGQPEVYRYDAGDELLDCLSCNPSGERPLGPAGLPAATSNGTGPAATVVYKPRALSADGDRVFFDSEDSLVPQDTNNDSDLYEWEQAGKGSCQAPEGCLALLSSGRAEGGARFIDASADGDDVFFITDGGLVAEDHDSFDLYDARVGGGLPMPLSVPECEGDSCQALPPEPDDTGPGTVFTGGLPNPPLAIKKKPSHHRHRHRHHPPHHHHPHRSKAR